MVWLASHVCRRERKQVVVVGSTARLQHAFQAYPPAVVAPASPPLQSAPPAMSTLPELGEDDSEIQESPSSTNGIPDVNPNDVENQNTGTAQIRDTIEIPTPDSWTGIFWFLRNYKLPELNDPAFSNKMNDLSDRCEAAKLAMDWRINILDNFHKIGSAVIVSSIAVIETWLSKNPDAPENTKRTLENLEVFIPLAASFFTEIGGVFRDRAISLKEVAVNSKDQISDDFANTQEATTLRLGR